MKQRVNIIMAALCFTVVCAVNLKAASSVVSDANIPKQDWKHPTDWLELGADLRLRAEYDNNRKLDNKAVDHERLTLPRFRVRTSAKIKITDDLDFNIRLITEPRYYIKPTSMDPQFVKNELLFDNFNLTWRNAFNMPLTIVAGRQELKFGNGWLVSDGTPLDSGRSSFFDALRFTYSFDASDTTMDVVLIKNSADSAKYLKPINDRDGREDNDLSEQDEQGAILYFAKKTGKDAGIDWYLIYKHDTDRKTSKGSEGEIYTPGVRKYGRLNERWQYDMEFAPQFGHKNGKSLGAFATNNQLIYNFNDEHKNKLYFGYEYLSGNDDPDKNFDRGWARIDSWSVLYQGYIDSIDGRSFDSSNLHRIYTDWETNLTEKLSLRCGYNLLFADENTYKGGTGGMSKSGNFRGQLARVMRKYKVSNAIEHRIEGEAFFPGDFYNNDKNDVALFVRYGLYLTW
ncbi:MAG: alginate export family protein [Phycisphaerae bacterium]